MADLWSQFDVDPRDPAQAGVRASDRDRDLVLGALGDAYAEGRITREEFDERSDQVTSSRTLGDLPAVLADLAPSTSLTKRPAADAPDRLHEQAVERYRRQRREAVWGALSASLICLVIWAATGFGFPWPAFVILGTGINAGRLIFMREDVITEEHRRLERRQERARADEPRRRQQESPDEGGSQPPH